MVSDYPERLEENGMLFTADLRGEQPSRFLYFHYNPPGQPDRRIVLHADNPSCEPMTCSLSAAVAARSQNEMAAGHVATKAFLVNAVQNQGRLIDDSGRLLDRNRHTRYSGRRDRLQHFAVARACRVAEAST